MNLPMDVQNNGSPRKRILLVEDDSSMRRFIEVTLHRADYEVVSAEDGLAAMKIALSENFNAVVTDAVMPNLSGHDLCRILRQNPNFKDVPLIILSGLEQEISTNIERDCADFYLVKGANLKQELMEQLAKFIAEKDKV